METPFVTDLAAAVGGGKVTTDDERRRRLSRDFFWYSQVLDARLRDCIAEVAVFAESEEDVRIAVEVAATHGVPITVRGGGTGNYGQAVPLAGGMVLDMTRMNRILEVGDGWMRAESGARLGRMEKVAGEQGQELRIFPSTYVKSTLGGFVAGGSGGIGSVTHGQLWDGNVLGCSLVTTDLPPRLVELSGPDVAGIIHAYGTTGILTEVTVPLAPKVRWAQLVTTFPSLDRSLEFSDALARDDTIRKRLVSVSEAAIAPLLNAAYPLFEPPYRDVVLLWVGEEDQERTRALARTFGGDVDRTLIYGRHPMLSDLSWNHTTLWARKVDPTWTYLQAGFTAQEAVRQSHAVKERYGDEVLLHFEYLRAAGAVAPAALPLLRYRSEARINEIIAFLESIGVSIANPHTWVLEEGGRKRQSWAHVYAAKRTYDPANLLNPGKLRGPLEDAR